MAASLNQVGIITHTVDDAALLLSTISGYDPADAQSLKQAEDMQDRSHDAYDAQTFRVALPKEFLGEGLDPLIKQRLLDYVARLQEQ